MEQEERELEREIDGVDRKKSLSVSLFLIILSSITRKNKILDIHLVLFTAWNAITDAQVIVMGMTMLAEKNLCIPLQNVSLWADKQTSEQKKKHDQFSMEWKRVAEKKKKSAKQNT